MKNLDDIKNLFDNFKSNAIQPPRTDQTNLNSEFNLVKSSNKLDVKNVVKVLENTANLVQIGKKLKKSQDVSKVLPKPLEKPQVERLKRSTGYDETKKRVGRWDAVVARSRTVDYVSFPLKHVSSKSIPTGEFLSKLKSKSPLEQELDEVDPQPEPEEEEEEEKMYPMSYEEMVEHRNQLAKLRAQQSFKASKAKRQSKIKSKKYHRILKKERLKQQLKEFEELQKTDPEEALKKLDSLEKARALERHTLRHKNTGKWAKSKLIRAKYDKDVRQQLAEQLAVSRGLTKKVPDDNSSDDDDPDNSATIPDITLSQDPSNPWMLKQGDKSNINTEFDFGYKKYLQDKMFKRSNQSDSESDEERDGKDVTDNNAVLNTENLETVVFKQHIQLTKVIESQNIPEEVETKSNVEKPLNIEMSPSKVNKKVKKTKVTATSNWIVETINVDTKPDISEAFDSFESNIMKQVEQKLKSLRENIEFLEKNPKAKKKQQKELNNDTENLDKLMFKNNKKKAFIDEQLIETGHKVDELNKRKAVIDEQLIETGHKVDELNKDESLDKFKKMLSVSHNNNEKPTNATNIDPSKFITAKPTYLNTTLPNGENDYDLFDDDEQVVPKVDIEDVFEEDDVVASFRQEKEEEIDKNTPKDIDLSLPGWGEWGGKGIKPSKRKRNRFILKAPPKVPRRDENKGDVIINEVKDPKLAVHIVSDLPFPFTSVKEYEASIRAPLGNTFVPEKAYQQLIRPAVITKAGTIIEPMDEDELLVPKNRNFKNENIIKLLGNKNMK